MPGLSQSLSQRLQLTQTQKHTMLLTLMRQLRGIQMNTQGLCPYCDYHLTKEELLTGFLDEVEDTTTQCPRCERRFQPKLVHSDRYSRIELPFYCAQQTLGRLTDAMVTMTPEAIEKAEPAVYYSALANFGSLVEAFKRLGVKYKQDMLKTWRTKVLPYLGEYPDILLAQAVGVSRQSVQAYRSKLCIAAHG